MTNEKKSWTDKQKTAIQQLQHLLGLLPMENPFAYVKAIQTDFDDSKVQYSDEYYEVTGIENPKGTDAPNKTLLELEPIVIKVHSKNDRA